MFPKGIFSFLVLTSTLLTTPLSGKADCYHLDGQKYKKETHRDLTVIALKSLKLSPERIKTISLASIEPDNVQGGLAGGFNQQWSHAYMFNSAKEVVWGDANEDFFDNLMYGNTTFVSTFNPDRQIGEGAESESFENGSAYLSYKLGDQKQGDFYVGYALHYIEDTSFTPHTSFPSQGRVDLLTHHFGLERYIFNNLLKGHKMADILSEDDVAYEVTDPYAALHIAAYNSGYFTSTLGKDMWDLYSEEGYPDGEGEGSPELVKAVTAVLKETLRWTRGTAISMLKYNNQIENQY